MSRALIVLVLAAAAGFSAHPAWALTPAGTVIQNRAAVNYTMSGLNINIYSSTTLTPVAEIVDVSVAPAMAGTTPVAPPFPTFGELLYFAVTNSGNSTENFALTVNGVVAGNDFDPDNPVVAIDAGTLGSFEGTGTDTLYSGPIPVPGETTIYVWVISDILDTVLSPGDIGRVTLEAVHQNAPASTAPGTIYIGSGPGGTDLVLGASGGHAAARGAYVIVTTTLSVVKSVAAIAGTVGGLPVTIPITGARITYQLDVIVAGSGTAAAVTVTDPVPANTTYVTGSLTFDPDGPGPAPPAGMTDTGADHPADRGEFTGGAIRVRLGDLTAGTRTITFQVTID
ncbi:MAG: hypothetical protein RRA15_00300 [bacterium]|nr:hypothetical protein [bacterium]MDT8364915.1 hypothetical protein [bacterium]